MISIELVRFNIKWYTYQNNFTQEQYANKTKFKIAYISVIETGIKYLHIHLCYFY